MLIDYALPWECSTLRFFVCRGTQMWRLQDTGERLCFSCLSLSLWWYRQSRFQTSSNFFPSNWRCFSSAHSHHVHGSSVTKCFTKKEALVRSSYCFLCKKFVLPYKAVHTLREAILLVFDDWYSYLPRISCFITPRRPNQRQCRCTAKDKRQECTYYDRY